MLPSIDKHREALLDQALADSFPASDPISTMSYDDELELVTPLDEDASPDIVRVSLPASKH